MTQKHPGERSHTGTAKAVIGFCVAMAVLLMSQRGIWLDEAASYWFSAHDITLDRMIRERWISDVHPPLFSAYAWLLQPLFGASVQEMRLINLGGLLYAALIWRSAWRQGLNHDFLMLFAVLVASSPFFILYAAEFRSYFVQLVLAACLIVQLRMVDEGRIGPVWLVPTAFLLTNLHFIGSLVGLILLCVEGIRLACSYRRRTALALLMIAIGSAVPLSCSLVAMLAVIEPVAVNQVSPLQGAIAIMAVVGAAALTNIVGMVALIRVDRFADGFARMLFGALATVMIVYFLFNLISQNLLPRHMIAAVPIGAAILALWLEPVVKMRRSLLALICANAVVLAASATVYGLVNKRWESNVSRIEAAVAACPQSRLYGLNTMTLVPAGDKLHGVPGIDHLFGLTYHLIANDAGMAVTIVPSAEPLRVEGRCPALLWVEHFYARQEISDLDLARIAGFEGPLRIVRLQRGEARALLAVSSPGY